jgi:uncharacterized protein YegL
MPILDPDADFATTAITGLRHYSFSGVRPEKLAEPSYILATVVCDISGSVQSFRDSLVTLMKTVHEGALMGPASRKILLRVVTFNHGVVELHGFTPLTDVDVSKYETINPYGSTALYDALVNAVGATVDYARQLAAQDIEAAGAVYVLTDGEDNRSTTTPASVAKASADSVSSEALTKMISVLIGINAAQCASYLDTLARDGGITERLDVNDATPAKLARLGGVISRSASSGGTPISATTF